MARSKTKRPRNAPAEVAREQALAVFADFAEQDVDQLFEFLVHCQIDLEPLIKKDAQLTDIIAAHFYVSPGVYNLEALGQCMATFPPIAERIREIRAEMAAKGCP